MEGPLGGGVARVAASGQGVSQIIVEAAGRVINVNLYGGGGGGGNNRFRSPGRGRGGYDDDVIEAEIVDKDTKWQ